MAASDTSHDRPRLAERLTRSLALARFTDRVRGSRAWTRYWAAYRTFLEAAGRRRARKYWHWYWRFVSRYMPKRLYARSLIIIITPMILLQSVVAFVFMERHWQTVTQRLSEAVVRDIAAIIDMIESYPNGDDYANLIRIAQDRLALKVDIMPPDPLPAPGPKPFFSILDEALGKEITDKIDRPFWLDTVGNSNIIEIRIQLEEQGAAGFRAAQPGLCLEHPHLPAVDGRHVAGAADDRDPLPAQPDPADHPARGSRREFRQGPAAAEQLPPARRRGGAPRRPRLHPDARAHRAPDRPAHGDADRRQP